MAVLFSAVTVTAIAKGEQVEFLVGGIPRELSDLEGWTAFDNFIGEIDEDMDISPKKSHTSICARATIPTSSTTDAKALRRSTLTLIGHPMNYSDWR